jgi:hypothetical protein
VLAPRSDGIAPHSHPSTTIGVATDDRIPIRRMASPDALEAWL